MCNSRFRFFAFLALIWTTMVVSAHAQDATPASDAQPSADAVYAASTRESQPRVTATLMSMEKDVTPPHVLSDPNPTYSEAARRAHYQATVVLGMVVAADGLVNDVRVTQGAGMGLDEEAMKAVKSWRFQPATKDGEPVAANMHVEVSFRVTEHEAESPLYSSAEANQTPPQFSGVNVTKYPLVLNVDRATGLPEGKTYQIVARAMIDDAVGKQSFEMFCYGNKYRCAFLNSGRYPARWIAGNHRLEILGKESPTGDWRRAEYTLKPE